MTRVSAPMQMASRMEMVRETGLFNELPRYEDGYVVSLVGEPPNMYRRLHHTGKCWRIPGRDYHDFQCFGVERPDPEFYDAVCKQCFPDLRRASGVAGVAAAALSSSTAGDSEDALAVDDD